jgi:hypothetical protein
MGGDFFPPFGKGSFDDPQTGCKGKIFDLFAGPFLALMAGIISFRLHAISYFTGTAETV